MESVLQLANVKKHFKSGRTVVKALDGVTLDIKRREVVLIMGPSGSGKSTMLSVAGTLLSPTTGQVTLNGKNITGLGQKELTEIRLKNIGFIFQSFLLLSALTAWENVLFVGQLTGQKGKELEDKVNEIMDQLGLAARKNDIPANLSGGEKQRVSIARAIINNPDLILADEPTANLDSKIGHEVAAMLEHVAKEHQKSVVIVSHDDRIKDIADRILYMEDGKLKK